MNAQHTPGPWHFTHETNAKRGRGKFLIVLPVGDTVPVCDVNRHRGPNSEANARVIAAFPEIIEALKKHLTWSETFFRYEGLSHDGPLQSDILETKDLIAKLEGRL